jgi:hypothetical protein
MIKVFEGGEGCTSGGRSERSSESGDLDRDDVRECCGEGRSVAMAVVMFLASWEEVGGMRGVEVCAVGLRGREAALCARLPAGFRMRLPSLMLRLARAKSGSHLPQPRLR